MVGRRRSAAVAILIRLCGAGVLLAGLAGALIAPLELHAFSLFSEGGKHHFAGFGFGSLMFANIAVQTAFYYLLAALGIPLGYGLLRRRGWARALLLALLYDWLALGLPLSVIALLMLLTSKGLPAWSLPLVGIVMLVLYPIAPLALIRFLRGTVAGAAFERSAGGSTWLERPSPLTLAAAGLMAFFAFFMHVPMLFNGLFPLFGRFLSGAPGMFALGLCALMLAATAWGLIGRQGWAWWAATILCGVFALSTILTLARVPFVEMFAPVNLAPLEREIVEQVPIRSMHLLVAVTLPLAGAVTLLVLARRPAGEKVC
jgi:hypothetical protein